MPAEKEGNKQHSAEINKIANNQLVPTFQNTIEAMERSGELLGNVITVFYALNSAETNETMQALAQEISPMLTDHSNSINLNEKLFNRVKAVYDQRNSLNLNPEQAQLLKKTYDSFANNGANLSAEDKEKYRELSKELSLATLQYGQNSLKETNAYSLLITDENVLAGMPADFMEAAAEKAKKAGKAGWMLDMRATSLGPVLTYADNRDLRREMWMASNTQCLPGSEFDNSGNI